MSGISISADSGTEFTADAAQYNSICALDGNDYAVVYQDNTDGNKGYINVGSRTGTSVTVNQSSAVVFYSSACKLMNISAMSSTLVIVGFVDTVTGRGYTVACTISGTTATVGTPVLSDGGQFSNGVAVASLDGTYFVSASASNSTQDLQCYVGSISGTTITLGVVDQTFAASVSTLQLGVAAVKLDSTHGVFSFLESATALVSNYAFSVNTGAKTFTKGTRVTGLSGTTDGSSIPVISSFGNNSFVIGALYGSTNTVYVNGATVSGVTITFGTKLATTNTTVAAASYSIVCMNSNSFLVSYYTTTGTQGEVVGGTISGNQVSWDAQGTVIFDNGLSAYTALCFLATGYFILGYKSG